jgi:hypothetical protein
MRNAAGPKIKRASRGLLWVRNCHHSEALVMGKVVPLAEVSKRVGIFGGIGSAARTVGVLS